MLCYILFSIIVLFPMISCQQPLPEMPFINLPVGDNKVIALTFDDGFDWALTASTNLLNVLKNYNIPATFFINTKNSADVTTEPGAQALLKRVINEGHLLADHTVHHHDLATMNPDQITSELDGVQYTVNSIIPGGYKLRIGRAPYGSPYVPGPTANTTTLSKVRSVFSQRFIQVSWSVDPEDYDCSSSPDPVNCTVSTIVNALTVQGRWGLVLLHSLYQSTADALPLLITRLTTLGYRFVGVEDIIMSYYGYNSQQIYDLCINQNTTVTGGVNLPIPIGGFPVNKQIDYLVYADGYTAPDPGVTQSNSPTGPSSSTWDDSAATLNANINNSVIIMIVSAFIALMSVLIL